jgi:uncharacterized protein YegL
MELIRQYPLKGQLFPVDAISETHIPCVLLLDTSPSMKGPKIDSLNRALVKFKEDTLEELSELKSRAVEIAIVEFNDDANVVQNFIPVRNMEPPLLETKGKSTAMGKGLRKALELIEQRKMDYDKMGTPRLRPWIFMITDGEPNDQDYESAFSLLRDKEAEKKVITWAIGVEGYNEGLLKRHMPVYETRIEGGSKKEQRIFRVQGQNFRQLFEWLSRSLVDLANAEPGVQAVVSRPVGNVTHVDDVFVIPN